jgi:transcriptional regulator with XRE-family HTH domain
VARRTAQKTSSPSLKLVEQRAVLGELIRRERLKRGWRQGQLAEHWGIRTQTVSAWERGHAPQRRFFGKIAEFTNLPDARAVELLLRGHDAEAEPVPAGSYDSPPVSDLQVRVVDAITRQLETGRKPSEELTKLFRELIAWAKQPMGELPADSGHPVTAGEDGAGFD